MPAEMLGKGADVLGCSARQKQTILMSGLPAGPGCALNDLSYKRPILRMCALHHHAMVGFSAGSNSKIL